MDRKPVQPAQLRLAALLALPLLGACGTRLGEPASFFGAPATKRSTPRDRYEAGLLGTPAAIGLEAWQNAGRSALREQLWIHPSFREVVLFDAARSTAVGYRFELRRGQHVDIEYRALSGEPATVFAEVYEEVKPPSEMFQHHFSARPGETRSRFQAPGDGAYVVRVQPALGASLTLEVLVTAAATLTFPVVSASLKSVGSWFGDPRDGGARDHEGIDILAPRGTTVVAVADGVITEVETTSVGGRVVWQRDDARNVTYYYAHLNQQHVREGQNVRAGDRIGAVGNTGNARAAQPHLHFAVYRPGMIALDPVPFLFEQPGNSPPPITADITALGRWTRISADRVPLRNSPVENAAAIRELSATSLVRLIGSVKDWHRVALEDGTTGFVHSSYVVLVPGIEREVRR